VVRISSFTLLSMLFFILSSTDTLAESPTAAKVNGVVITQKKYDRVFDTYLQQHGLHVTAIKEPEQYKALKRQVLDVLISQELLWQEAQKKNVIATPQQVENAREQIIKALPSKEVYRDRLRQAGFTEESYTEDLKKRLSASLLIQQEISPTVSVSDTEVHEFYTANSARFKTPEQIHARHILIKVKPDANEATKEVARKQISAILAKAKAGEDFAELAIKYSEGPTGPKGGDLGFFGRGQMVPSFEEAAFALKPGEISDVVRTRFGFHIIKIDEHRAAAVVSEKDANARIRQYLVQTKTQQAVGEWTTKLREQGKVEILVPL
jgi:peptidyl-prolyl cis-trans isomerase C